ncbi:YcnI family protein [Actinomadura atramentaria]|uniref:YcnI family copper-binding membrane protein n=1 Tax=Actinomadura atramentaria TaxID=1990 RepID=UPI000399EBEB|nr:YcnI family protein [Actinomadura atramentaria]
MSARVLVQSSVLSPAVGSSLRRAAVVAGIAGAAVLGLGAAASAHVTANPGTAPKGGYAKITFRVPNERDDAATTKVVVHLPQDHPIPSVSVRPVPGWTAKVEEAKLPKPVTVNGTELTKAPATVTWTGGKIEPGQFQEFDVSLGPIPGDTDRLLFPADQTYSGGEVVKWDQTPAEGAAEPEHPAPSVTLTAATGEHGAAPAPSPTAHAGSGSASSDDGTARLLGGLGLAAGVLGVGTGAFALTRARSRS